jgi:hypothetical protein
MIRSHQLCPPASSACRSTRHINHLFRQPLGRSLEYYPSLFIPKYSAHTHPLIQIILALRAQVQQGNMTHKQALDRLSMMQASSAHSFNERSAPQQLPRAIQTQDALHRHQFNTHICQGPQLQNDSGLTSRMSSNPNPLRMDPSQDSQGPGTMQEIFPPVPYANVPSSSAPSASQPPPRPHSILDVPLPQLRALYTQLVHIIMEGEKALRSSSEGDIQLHIRAKLELNKSHLSALQEIIDVKVWAR